MLPFILIIYGHAFHRSKRKTEFGTTEAILGDNMRVWVLLIIFVMTAFSTADIDTDLREKMDASGNGEMLRAALQVDRPGIRDALMPCKEMRGTDRREFALAIIEDFSARAIEPLLREMFELKSHGLIDDIQQLKLGGSVGFTGTREAIEMIAARSDVLRIIDNSPRMLIEAEENIRDRMRPLAPMIPTWAVEMVHADDVWALGYTGLGVIVGITDSGVRYTHVDLADHMWTNDAEIPGNGVDDDLNGYIDDYYGYDFINGDGDPADDHGHGTSCAGIVAGDGTGGSDDTGVAPDALIMALKVIGSSGSGMPSDLINGIEYGIDMGVTVFSVSLGWEDPSNSIKDWFRVNLEDALAAGALVVTSAGNGRDAGGHYAVPQDISAPADCPSPGQSGASTNTAIVSVGAITQFNTIASFSSRGVTHWNTVDYSDFPYPPGLMKPELSAPGQNVTTTSYSGDYSYNYGFGGTSASAPFVAGAVALALSKNPGLTPEEIDTLLQNSAHDLGPAGHDTAFGAGRLDCLELINSVSTPTYPILRVENSGTDDTPPPGDGSGVFDKDEHVKLIVDVKNIGLDASVTGTASSLGDPFISVTDSNAAWGTITTGTSADNDGDPFIIYASNATPPAYTAGIQVTLTASGYTFVETVQVSVGVYPREYNDHTTPTLSTSVTNFGSFGFFDPTMPSEIGNGFQFNGVQTLYGGGFFLGIASSNVITWEGGSSSEFLPIMPLVAGTCAEGDCYYTCYADPQTGVIITQRTFTFDSPPDQDYIILEAAVKNRGASTRADLFIGFFLDFDIHVESGPTWFDRGNWVNSSDWGYMWDEGSTPAFTGYVGLVGLTGIAHGSMVENDVYIYPTGMGWADTVKYNFMSGAFFDPDGSPAEDWSLIGAEGPFTLAPYEDYLWAVAVVAGDNLSDWESNAMTAIGKYSSLRVGVSHIPCAVSLDISPNPFNSVCAIRVLGESKGIEIYDISGRIVRSFEINGDISTGQKVLWDGRDVDGKDVSSGIYFVRCKSVGLRAKVVLLR